MTTTHTFTTGEGEPDFTVRCSDDPSIEFRVQRSALVAGSEIFADMFSVCDVPDAGWEDIGDSKSAHIIPSESSMVMPEKADVMQMLFRVLHEPPVLFTTAKAMMKWDKTPGYMQDHENKPFPLEGSAIPLPLLKNLYVLADKYALKPDLVSTLHSHLAANALKEPLQVYAYASAMEGPDALEVAAFASTKLYYPPLESYTPEDLAIMPSVQSLQLLYVLHAHRRQRLQEILANEELYPHDYGKCTAWGHANKIEEAWRKQKRYLLSMGRITAATDLATEMSVVEKDVNGCKSCYHPFSAAIKMLQYKSAKIPRSIAKLPTIPREGLSAAPTASLIM
ncbi:hypothetical protein CPB86DRAFT_784937 [Serendipita vermifera]|nr:hypothetical protein CPB86DRAFT_784937 [Serendipita vermifera]